MYLLVLTLLVLLRLLLLDGVDLLACLHSCIKVTQIVSQQGLLMGCKWLLSFTQKCSLVYVSLFLSCLYSLLMQLNYLGSLLNALHI
jgi:hypothetical protein